MATYLRAPGDDAYGHRSFAIGVRRIECGHIAEIVAFHGPALFLAFGLPETLPAEPADEGRTVSRRATVTTPVTPLDPEASWPSSSTPRSHPSTAS